METIALWLSRTSDYIYLYILIFMLVFCGLYFSFRTKFAQIKLFPNAVKLISEKTSDSKKVSAFQALMICTASKVGTANIAGVATAIAIGGPGSMFWMWIMAVIGCASSMAEATLAQIYKTKHGDNFVGGPAYYIHKALNLKWLGKIFSGLFLFCFLFGFNSLQAHNMSSSLKYYIKNYENTCWPYLIGILFAVGVLYVVLGGIKRIGFVTSYLVPIMSCLYILLGLGIIIANFSRIPEVLSYIISSAFDFKAILGGTGGKAILIGVKRGLLSNEAGMGSAPNAAATADTSHPAKQGIIQILSVFIDTVLICSTSAFIVLFSNVNINKDIIGMPLMQKVMHSYLGEFGVHFITSSIILFAFSAIVGNFGFCEPNILFINNNEKIIKFIRILGILPIIFGCITSSSVAWDLADISMALIAILNIIIILLLSNKYLVCFKDYISQKKLGLNPVFNSEKNSIKTECW